MTETELKIADSWVQLRLAERYEGDEAIFRSCINAVIEMGRSVTFVMQAESARQPGLTEWYRTALASLPKQELLHFFNQKRIYTVHRGVVTPTKELRRTWGPFRAANGNRLWRTFRRSVWVLDGSDDCGSDSGKPALQLCRDYLELLQSLVDAWIHEGRGYQP